jgi:parallel beta-helix repeat protein
MKFKFFVFTLMFVMFAVVNLQAATCFSTGFFRDSTNMTAAQINPTGTVSGPVDATGCNIGIYYDQGIGAVNKAIVNGANYFGVAVNGDNNVVAVNVTNSTVSNIGETPLNGTQHGVGIYYRAFGTTGSTSGKVTGNTITNYQKGGIVVNGASTVTVSGNTVTGQGPVDYIAQNGIQVGYLTLQGSTLK